MNYSSTAKNLAQAFLALGLLATGCDVVEKDAQPKGQHVNIQLVTSPNKIGVIDLQKVFSSYQSVSLPANSPKLTYFGDRYIKYVSNEVSGDAFSFNLVQNNQNVQANVSLSAEGTSTDCTANPAFATASVSNTSILVVNLLNNPEFCDFDIHSSLELGVSGSRAGIDVDQNAGPVLIEIASDPVQGNSAILTYVPPAGFVGQVKFTYYLHAGATEEALNTYGSAVYFDPQYSQYFSTHSVVIDVTQ